MASTEDNIVLRDRPSGLCLRPIGLLALVCFLALMAATASWAVIDDRPIVVLRIDDCQASWLTPYVGLGGASGLTYGKSKHIPITWAVISGFASSGLSMTWAQIKDYLDTCGGEPASHSVNHSSMPTQQDYVNELVDSKAAIQANLPGYQCNTFLQPGTWTGEAYMDRYTKLDNPIGQAIQANYAQSMAYLGAGWMIGNSHCAYGLAAPLCIDSLSCSVSAINSILETAVANTPGLVWVITGHGVQEQGQSAAYRIPADVLKATMDKLAELRDQGKIRLMSLHDAYHASFSPDLNSVPNPGFELINYSQNYYVWSRYGSAQIAATGGVGDSGHCSMPDGAAKIQSSFLIVPPGRYEMTWYQKVINGKANNGMFLAYATLDQGAVTQYNCANWALFYNSSPVTEWQKKTALALVLDRLNLSQLTFQSASGGGYGIDNVSIVSAPIDAAISPSASIVTPSPGQCTISWHTPNDPSVTSVVVRYNSGTHPLTPTSGSSLCNVTAHRNEVQQVTVPLAWTGLTYAYISVFGVRSDSSFTPPDLAIVKVDRSPPTTPNVTATADPDGTIRSQWTSAEPDSQIVQYQYAVGHDPGGNDLKNWTTTTGTSATITGIPLETSGYVSAKAQNAYGFWSDCGSVRMYTRVGISLAVALPNGRPVSVSGKVTAVFSDCCYIEDADRTRGLKIVGDVSHFQEGQAISVGGILATSNGERYLAMQ